MLYFRIEGFDVSLFTMWFNFFQCCSMLFNVVPILSAGFQVLPVRSSPCPIEALQTLKFKVLFWSLKSFPKVFQSYCPMLFNAVQSASQSNRCIKDLWRECERWERELRMGVETLNLRVKVSNSESGTLFPINNGKWVAHFCTQIEQ